MKRNVRSTDVYSRAFYWQYMTSCILFYMIAYNVLQYDARPMCRRCVWDYMYGWDRWDTECKLLANDKAKLTWVEWLLTNRHDMPFILGRVSNSPDYAFYSTVYSINIHIYWWSKALISAMRIQFVVCSLKVNIEK